MKSTLSIVLFFIVTISVTLSSCLNKPTQSTSQHSVLQHESDLLASTYKAVCYSGFREGQHPDRGQGAVNPSRDEILEDLIILTEVEGFELIRLYDSGENSKAVLELIREHNLNLQVMLGIWLSAELSNHEGCEWLTEPIPEETMKINKQVNAAEIDRGIDLANQYQDIVVAVNVGNEALVDWNDHLVEVDTLISYVHKVKKQIKQPVTVAENYEWWAANGKKLAAELDFIAIHIYPIWEGRDIEDGITYSIENVQKVKNALPDCRIVISEAGWATTSSEFGDRAGEEKQKIYYDWIMQWSKENNITTFFFAAFDEPWKGDPNDPHGAEKHWGLYFVDRNPKLVLKK